MLDINKKFSELSNKLEGLQKHELTSVPNSDQNSDNSSPHPTANCSHNESYINEEIDNFLDTDSCSKLVDYFNDRNFTQENGHSVLSFGEQYRYTGSKSEPTEIPSIINSVIDKINEKFDLEGDLKINSCLVNKFSGPESKLNKHSDDEMNIHPESRIFTVSLGDPRTVVFREVSSDSKFERELSKGSLYSMTRKSQNYFKHEIPKDELFNGLRYSLTFRTVHWHYWNSTCIIGDSNTRNLKFGSEVGTFGPSTPGKSFFVPTVEQINPHNCVGYNNIIIMCGINNIKVGSIRNQSGIQNVYTILKSKIQSISKLNNKAKIFICPILPTKSRELNKKALYFNQLIFNDLVMCNFRVSVVHGFNDFVDPADTLLSRNYSKPHMNDLLHLNEKGVKLLAKNIKSSIFQRKKSGSTSRINSGRPYSDALQRGSAPT